MKIMSSLQQEAYNYIKKLILTNQLDVNIMYSETKLSKELGISRTPMREALQCLSQDGYIDVVPSKGFRIRQLNQKDMKETIQIRCAIEGFCTHSLASTINTPKGQKVLRELENILDLQSKAAENSSTDGNYEDFINYDHQFHLLLVNYINNEEVNHIFQRLMYLIKLTSQSALEVEGRVTGTLEEHKKYFDYLKAGNGDDAYHILINHLMMPLNVVKTKK